MSGKHKGSTGTERGLNVIPNHNHNLSFCQLCQMQNILQICLNWRELESNVLISGTDMPDCVPKGTLKENNPLHASRGPRRAHRFLKVNSKGINVSNMEENINQKVKIPHFLSEFTPLTVQTYADNLYITVWLVHSCICVGLSREKPTSPTLKSLTACCRSQQQNMWVHIQ